MLIACGSKGESQVRKEKVLSGESLRIVTLTVSGDWAVDSEIATSPSGAWLGDMLKKICEVLLLLRW